MDTLAHAIVTIARGQIKQWNTFTKRRARRTEKFENEELAAFLEDTVHSLFDLNPNAVAVVAVNDDAGIAGTNYHNCGVEDKGRMMHHILEDIVMDIVLSNIDIIRNMLTEDENDEDGGDDDGDE